MAKRLVREGTLLPVAHGLFSCPRRSRFGLVPSKEEEVMRAFLDGGRFLFTGPEMWNSLGLGTTALFSSPLVYNTKRSGAFDLGGRRFTLRRVAFPDHPTPEWFVIDLLEHAEAAGASRRGIAKELRRAVRQGAFDAERLRELASRYGTRATRAIVDECLEVGR